MKKLFVLGALGVFALSSCKKDYTCECTTTGFTQAFEYKGVKKKDANETCDAQEATYKALYPNIVCNLK